MNKNVGNLDAYLRVGGGLSLLGIGILKKSTALLVLGSFMTAKGVTRFCPIYHMMGLSTNKDGAILKFSKKFLDENDYNENVYDVDEDSNDENEDIYTY